MRLLQALETDGLEMKRASNREYSGPCPFCGGQDRFRVWPDSGENGRYWCRRCTRKGDLIQYFRESRKVCYRDACNLAGTEPRESFRFERMTFRRKQWTPKEAQPPCIAWQAAAKKFLDLATHELWEKGDAILTWLESRGIQRATTLKAMLGLNTLQRYGTGEEWGLQTGKKAWIPKGLVIPFFRDAHLWRLRVRTNSRAKRYLLVEGGKSKPMILGEAAECWIITESELDGLLIDQEAGDLISTIALGSVALKPDIEVYGLLKRARIILINLDFDAAGKEKAQWWLKNYQQALFWPVPKGKDPGEYFACGGTIRKWIQAGLLYGKTTKV